MTEIHLQRYKINGVWILREPMTPEELKEHKKHIRREYEKRKREGKPKLHRYKVDGKWVFLPPKTEEEMRLWRKAYNKKWCAENPEKVKANQLRYQNLQRKLYLESLAKK
jgi:hypothetical protein